MTVKGFFKSNAFKCIVTLLCVLLVSGIFLTIAYGLLEVSEGERLQRAISKIYTGDAPIIHGVDENGNDKVITSSEKNPKSLVKNTLKVGKAEILAAYKITFEGADDVHYLVQSRGKEGYSGGTVTCWVAVNVDETGKQIKNIAKVQIGGNTAQTLMNKITDSLLASFTKSLPEDGFYPDDGYAVSGATLSCTAICNSVNGAVGYVNEEIFGIKKENVYKDFFYTEYIDVARTKHTVEGKNVTYNIVTNPYLQAKAFTIDITVGEGAAITAYRIAHNGSTNHYDDDQPTDIKDGTLFIGKTLSYFTGIYGSDMNYTEHAGNVTGGASASKSNYLCMYAAAFATANYEKCTGGAV